MRAQALIGLNMVAKTFGDALASPYVVAYELEDLPVDPLAACEAMFLWSNAEGRLHLPLSMLCRAQTGPLVPPAYNGPSLSMGDVVRLDDDRADTSWWTCASVGFERLDDPAALQIVEDPAYVPPRATLDGRIITPGSDWKIWMDRMMDETIGES